MGSFLERFRALTERVWWDVTTARVLVILAVLMALRLWAVSATPLLWDEPYYWMWSRYPSFGYFDHPPMIAWWIWAGTALAGDGTFGLRSPVLVNMIASAGLIYGLARTAFDHPTAIRSVLWASVTPLIGIAGILVTPDAPSVFFWLAATFAFFMVVRTERGVWWLAVGLAAGLGVVSKYTNLFLGAGLVVAMLADPRLRRWLVSPWTWAGGALAVAVMAPTFFWNAAHDWVSFRFQFGRVTPETVETGSLLTLLIVQPLAFNPFAAVFLGVGGFLWWRTRGTEQGRTIGLLFLTVAPAIVFVLVQSTYTTVLQHWLVPTFPTLTIIAVAAAMSLDVDRHRWLRRGRANAVPFAVGAMVVAFAYVTTPSDRFMPGKDPIDSMRGWPAFARDVEALRVESGAGWVASVGYAMTAQLTYELRDKAVVIPVSERERYTYLPGVDVRYRTEPGLLIARERTDAAQILVCFETAERVGEVAREGARRTIRRSAAWLVAGARPNLFEAGCDLDPATW